MKILHETCLKYFRRRLSEGWKCISLEGHNAVLLSPEGIRRELDLRNDVETLRPNAHGDVTQLNYYKDAWYAPDPDNNYKQVDEETPDEDSTFVYTSTGADKYDLYNLPAHSGSGTIKKITVYIRCRHSFGFNTGTVYEVIKIGGSTYYGTGRTPSQSWTTYSHEWTKNPADNEDWEWPDIDVTQIGVRLKTSVDGLDRCTQNYVEVDFTYTPPTPPAAPEYQKREIARIGSEAEATLKEILSRVTEFAADSGTATGGSQTTCVDTAKNWEADMWKGAVIEIYSVADDVYYLRTVSGNTATTITLAALPGGKAVASGDPYAIRLTVGEVDLDKWGGTVLTGRDVSLDLKALTDDSIKGLLKSIGDIAALENLITRIGQTTDATVAAGAAGSISAKLRRVTQGLEDLKTLITLTQLPAALTAAGNLKQSIEERLISKTIRDIAPGAPGTFWLPETGNIDLSKYLSSSWGIYAPTTATMTINCYLNISHDGGTIWRRAAGYEVLDADFVRDAWNTIDCPLKLAEAKLEVVIGVAAPAELDLMCIAKP